MHDLEVSPSLTIPAAELTIQFARSGGPGGQNVNKVASKVELRWDLASSTAVGEDDRAWLLGKLKSRLTTEGVLIVTSTATRDQIKNRDDAESKLVLMLRTALERPKKRTPTKPSKGAKRRRVADKRHASAIKKNRSGSGDW